MAGLFCFSRNYNAPREKEEENRMQKTDLLKELSGNTYPGRGIVLGKHADGKHAEIAYFIKI